VEVYVVALAVEGLQSAVLHYRPTFEDLQVVREAIDPAEIVGAALPEEKDMIARPSARM
jgi:hypothetical protein